MFTLMSWTLMCVFNRLDEADRYNNVEVISLDEARLDELVGGTANPVVVITVQSHSLSTKYQPVSIVVTGQFSFASVVVKDDKTNDYEDKITIPVDLEMIVLIGIIVVLVILLIFCWW